MGWLKQRLCFALKPSCWYVVNMVASCWEYMCILPRTGLWHHQYMKLFYFAIISIFYYSNILSTAASLQKNAYFCFSSNWWLKLPYSSHRHLCPIIDQNCVPRVPHYEGLYCGNSKVLLLRRIKRWLISSFYLFTNLTGFIGERIGFNISKIIVISFIQTNDTEQVKSCTCNDNKISPTVCNTFAIYLWKLAMFATSLRKTI